MENTIEYKFSSDISVYFSPIENGKAEYFCEVHDFGNLNCFIFGRVSYNELSEIIKSPVEYQKYHY